MTGRDLCGLTAGILGTGRIGRVMAEILSGFGMNIELYDIYPSKEWAEEKGFKYVQLDQLFKDSDVLSLHCPLTEDTKHIINKHSLALMKKDTVIINTGRGALIDSQDLVYALKKQFIGGAALDVYEEESKYFFDDWSVDVIREISPEALVKVYKATGYEASGKVGVKVSTGESENSNYLRPALIKNVGADQKVLSC